MIHAVIVMNTHGKPRVTKFYKNVCDRSHGKYPTAAAASSLHAIQESVENDSYGKAGDEQQEIISAIHSALSSEGENFCNFIESDDIFGPDTQLVYKHFATLYFVFAIDKAENELAILDLIQLFVEVLDKAFKNVCELDIVYNFNKVHTILDEIIVGGMVVETNSAEIWRAVQEIEKLEKEPESTPIKTKAFGRR